MLKTDPESLEKMSFLLDERSLANFADTIAKLRAAGLTTLNSSEFDGILNTLDAVGQLKLDGKVYGFHVYDSFARDRNGDEGVELYLRQGNTLKDYFIGTCRDRVYSPEEAAEYMKKHEKRTVYTGEFPYKSRFLGLPQYSDPEDPITREILTQDEIGVFESRGIEVIKLDRLV